MTTPQKLSTGVDARNIRNIVLMRPINKIIECFVFYGAPPIRGANCSMALPPLSREERAQKAKVIIRTEFNSKQQVFLNFVLSHDVSVTVARL